MNPEPTWRNDVRSADGHTVVELAGEIDMSGSARLQDLLDHAVDAARTVTVDLAEVQFIDSTVIGAFVKAYTTATARGCRSWLSTPARRYAVSCRSLVSSTSWPRTPLERPGTNRSPTPLTDWAVVTRRGATWSDLPATIVVRPHP